MVYEYNRDAVLAYAQQWALSRNPEYFDFAGIGGDCTNFASQCVYAGAPVMNYTPDIGWYFINIDNRSPSWSGTNAFYNFMTTNTGEGPFAEERTLDGLELGDIIQLANSNGEYYHTLVLTGIRYTVFGRRYFVSAHTRDVYMRRLNSYNYADLRGIHILGYRSGM